MITYNICGGHAFRIAFVITVLSILLLVGSAGAAIPINSCTTIDSPGIYVLNKNIINSGASTCIYINSSNVVFDGAGYTIDGIDTDLTIGVYVYNPSNTLTDVTIKNLKVTDWNIGIYYQDVVYGNIQNNIANSNTNKGIFISNSHNNMLSGNNASNNDQGIVLYYSSNNNLIKNMANINDYIGINLDSSSNNILTDNIASQNHYYGVVFSNFNANYILSNNRIYNNLFNNSINFLVFGTIYTNYWNNPMTAGTNIVGGPYLGGNFWGNPSGTDFSQTCTDADSDGICDAPYILDGGNIDYLPLAYNKPSSILKSITVSPSSASVKAWDTQTFTATPKDQNGNPMNVPVIWSSSDTRVGPIDPNTGMFTGRAPGTYTITATSGSVSGSASVTVYQVDTDGDGLFDDWETHGIDSDRDGNIDLQLLGANPNHKDVFVEVDYMQFHRPREDAINDVVTAFANSPVSNPDGTNGINLHVTIDGQVPHQDSLTIWSGFDEIKRNNFGTATERADANSVNILEAKRSAYHYALFIHGQAGNTWSGISEGNFNDGEPATGYNDFIVSLGATGFGVDTSTGHTVGSRDEQAGTFMHELGHNLGLRHGGGDNENCKPNYLSIMSYSRQMSYYIADRPLDYSNEVISSLDENNLNEIVGVPSISRLTTVYGPLPFRISATGIGTRIDWNRDGDASDTGVISNINNIGISGCNGADFKTLRGFNDWNSLQYNFRASSEFVDGVHTHGLTPPEIPEVTIEVVREIRISNINALDNAIQNLPETAFDKPKLAIQRKNALHNKLLLDSDSVAALIQADDLQNASDKLIHDIRAKMDGSIGGDPKNDWITDSNAQKQLLEILDNFVATLRKAMN